MKFFPLAVALALCSLISQADARPPLAANRQRGEQPPKLSDTLTVAKSPFEPVTLANNRPNARNDGRPEGEPTTTTPLPELDVDHKLRTTRSAVDSFEQQQQSSSSTKGLDESTGLQDSVAAAGSSQSEATERPEGTTTASNEVTVAATEPPAEAETKSSEQEEATTIATTAAIPTTTTQAPADEVRAESQPPEAAPPTTTTTTTTTQEPSTTTTEAATTTAAPTTTTTITTPAPAKEAETAVPDPTTTTSTTTTTTTTTSLAPTTEPAVEETTSAAPPQASTPEVAPESPPADSTEAPATATTTKTAASQPETEPTKASAELQRDQTSTTSTTTTTAQPETTTTLITTTTTTTSTTTTTPEPAAVASSSPAPAPVESTGAEPRPATPAAAGGDKDKVEEKEPCNHLPTYNADEIQRVFREETTYKNGTIKGKFTYINFDQRYRLVHYTRLPYGPVKIDHVEELGRPKQSDGGNQTAPPTLSEVPNAVLQLRNLLPNSLFGFPFLNPSSASGQLRPREDDDERSNIYFYSTDSLTAPNLLTPRVPVSLLPGQRVKIAQTTPGGSGPPGESNALARSYLEQSSAAAAAAATAAAAASSAQQQAAAKPFGMPTPPAGAPWTLEGRPQDASNPFGQFHYAHPAAASQQLESAKSFVYPHFGSHAQPVHYQYAPLSPAAFQPLRHAQPYFHHRAQHGPSQLDLHTAAHHQPHGHEHYVAQYMLSQPPASGDAAHPGEPVALAQAENSRLRLRVKTSKSLNVGSPGTKSAQMRLQPMPSEGHFSAPVNSPAQAAHHHQHQQNQHKGQQQQQQQQRRLGKQSPQLKSAPANQAPVVYHVLRNPAGRVFTQYNQGYAVAYDHK